MSMHPMAERDLLHTSRFAYIVHPQLSPSQAMYVPVCDAAKERLAKRSMFLIKLL